MIRVQLKNLLKQLNKPMTQALEGAAALCVSQTHYEVSVEHLLAKMAEDATSDLQEILRHYELEPSEFIKAIHRSLESFRTGNPGKPVFAPFLVDLLQEACLLNAVELGGGPIRSGAVFLTLALNPSRSSISDYTDAFERINVEDLRKNFSDVVAGTSEDQIAPSAEGGDEPESGAPRVHGREADSALAKFTIDFTAEARAGRIDPIFERDREIHQMIDILARRRKNNPIIVGEPGVGKTALIEGLALRIASGDVPEIIEDCDLLSLDMGLLQAGASMKGEFENRLKKVISEVKGSVKPVILFIDEAHTVIGAGGPAGGGDAANLLKPALARGELRTIAATTWSEYKKYFEKDPALARRFQVVKCEEPTEKAAVSMMRGLADTYEQSHGVRVRDDAVVASVELANRYISGRLLPDKSVDVLDTAAARVKVSLTTKPNDLDFMERKIVSLQREIDARNRDREVGVEIDERDMAELGQKIEQLRTDAEAVRVQWQKEKDLAEVIIQLHRGIEDAKNGGGGDEEETSEQAENGAEGASNGAADEAAPAASVEELEAQLEAKRAELNEVRGKDPLVYIDVNPEVVAKVIADWTGIPMGNMVRDEAASILRLEDDMKERIQGQDHALAAIAKGIRAAKAGVGNPDTPLGVFLLVGSSGVGKTETALSLADELFGGERSMVTINMSEFQEGHSVSRLVGSPPGYVGYGEGGILTEAVRQRPYTVVLLDECEKAHLDVLNLFYQVFDKGMLSDGEGRVIDFKNTVVFLTSNLATDEIMTLTGGPTPISAEDLLAGIRPVLSKHFKPALLARMSVIPFFPLRGEAMRNIVRLKMNKVGKRLASSHRMGFDYSDSVVDQIAERCTEVETGARNIDHILNGSLLPQISTAILEQMGGAGVPDHLRLDLDENGEFELKFSSGCAPPKGAAQPEPEPAGTS